MRWLLLLLQWAYPLALLLAGASRASFPSLVYLLCFFFSVCWPPLRELRGPGSAAGDLTGAVTTGIATPLGPSSTATGRRGQHVRNKSSAVGISASSSFAVSNQATVGGGPAPVHASSPFLQSSTWQAYRAFFKWMALFSAVMLIAQIVVHAMYWGNVWHPAGITDGDNLPDPAPLLIQTLQLFSLAPWISVRNGAHLLLPDIGVLVMSIIALVATKLSGKGTIRWLYRAYCCGKDADELSLLSRGGRMQRAANSSAQTLSTSVIVLHFSMCLALFFSGILQPSLLSLPYYLGLCAIVAAHVWFQPLQQADNTGSGGGMAELREEDASIVHRLFFIHGSSAQYGMLGATAAYLMAHLTLLHIFQWPIVVQSIDMSSGAIAQLGLFQVDIEVWNGVALVQWAFLVSLIVCLITVSLKRLSLEVLTPPPMGLTGMPWGTGTLRKPVLARPQSGSDMSSPLPPPMLRAASQRTAGGDERKDGPRLHASPAALEAAAAAASSSPSPSPPVSGSAIRRSLFSQSSFELKSLVERSFRNHGLLLICALILVQVMMVHDIFNILNVGMLLLAMSLANIAHARWWLMALLHVQVVFLMASTLVKYICYIPALIPTPLNADDIHADRQTVMATFGLIKHVDGFTPREERTGSFVFLYLLDGVLPALLIAIYLIVHRVSAANLNVFNLFNAASTGDTSLLQRFIDTTPGMLNVRDFMHKTVLHVAARNGHVATVRMIMDHVDVNAQDKLGNTALHYCYKYGYDSLIHLLLTAGSKGCSLASGRGRQSLNLINTELLNKRGQKPSDMRQNWWTRVKRKVRGFALVIESFFFANASKLTLLLLFVVSSQSVNVLHMVYFIFFLLFFSTEQLARRLWSVLVAYCALVFFTLYSFSVLEPLYSLHTRELNANTDWLRYLGLFSVRDDAADEEDRLDMWWSRLLIYYGIYVLAIMQRLVYRRGLELGLIESTEGTAAADKAAHMHEHEDELDRHLLQSKQQRSSLFERVSIVLLTYGTLLTVSMLSVSLFHLGYLFIFVVSLAVHQFSRQASRILSAFWFVCILFTGTVLFAQYAYLLPDFRHWLSRHFNWHRFSLTDVGFRSPTDDDDDSNSNGNSEGFSNTTVLLILLPPTACFVMCVYYLKALWMEIKVKQQESAREQMASELSTSSRPLRTGTSRAASIAARRRNFGTMRAPSRSPAAPGHRRSSSGGHAMEFPPPAASASTTIDIEASPPPPVQPDHAHSLMDFSLFTHEEWAKIQTYLYAAYLFSVNVLAHQTAQLLTLFILLTVLLINPLSLLNLTYIAVLLVWLPLDGRSLGNSLWIPLTLYSIPLILAKYLFQFPSLVSSENSLANWIGFRAFDGHLIRHLVGDLVILVLATVQRVATNTMKVMVAEKKKIREEEAAVRQRQQLAADSELESSFGAEAGARLNIQQPTPLEQKQARDAAVLKLEAERLRQQHAMLDSLAEEDDVELDTSPELSVSRGSARPRGKSHSSASSGRAAASAPRPSIPADTTESKPTTAEVKPQKPDRRTYVLAILRELWVHLLDVVSAFYRKYGLEIFLLFLLLTAFARSNLLSLVYVLFYCGCWIQFGGRSVLVRSRFMYVSLLVLLAVSIVWQYLILLGMPPDWLSSHSLPWHSWDAVIQQWMLVGYYSTRDMMWDAWCFVFLAWFMPYWRNERAALASEGRLGRSCWPCARDDPASVTAKASVASSGSATPKLQQRLLDSEERRSAAAERASPTLGEGSMYVPPSMARPLTPPLADSPSTRDTHALNLLKGDTNAAVLYPHVSKLWDRAVLYSGLVIDKALFLFIFFIGTSHNNLFSCVYLVFCCWYIFQNYLFDEQPALFRGMWRTLRKWNYAILVAFIVFQIPWFPYVFLSTATLRWEMTIGLHRFVFPPPESTEFSNKEYLRVWTEPLGDRGALPQIFIFLLIEVQLLILGSKTFQRRVLAYYADIRRLSEVRSAASTLLYKEWLLQRVKTILLFREKLEANFSYIFLQAAKLNIDHFQDEVVWPQAKPAGWDQRVNNLLLEDSLKQYSRERSKKLHTGTADDGGDGKDHSKPRKAQGSATSEEAAAVFSSSVSPPAHFIASALRGEGERKGLVESSPAAKPKGSPAPGHDSTGSADLRAAFQGMSAGPIQQSSMEESGSPDASPAALLSRSPTSADLLLLAKTRQTPSGREMVLEGADLDDDGALALHAQAVHKHHLHDHPPKVPKTLTQRVLHWLQRPMLAYIDPVFWTQYAVDPKTGEMHAVRVPDAHTYTFSRVVWRFWLSNTQWLCFSLYFLNLLLNGNFLSLVIPVLILCHAIFERPRVSRGFWLFALLWSSIVISAKFVFQLYIFCVITETYSDTAGSAQVNRKYILAPSPLCPEPGAASNIDNYSQDALFGLRKLNTHTYFTIILIDLICMLSVVLHRTVLLARGLWVLNEEEHIAQQERRRRLELEQKNADEEEEEDETAPNKGVAASGDVLGKQPTLASLPSESATSAIVPSLQLNGIELEAERRVAEAINPRTADGEENEYNVTLRLLQQAEEQQQADAMRSQVRDQKAMSFMGKLRRRAKRLWLEWVPLEIQCYYAELMPRERFHGLNVNKPGYDWYLWLFLIELFSAIWILICYDHMASTSVNSVSSSLSTNLFSGNMVLMLFVQIVIIILDRVCYLFRSVFCKLLLQYATISWWCAKIFFEWPVSSQTAFNANSYLQFFFVVKLFYFIVSGLQIFTGYPPLETAGFQFLTRYPGMYAVYAYKAYRAIPFVFELRTMLDWMCSVSSLDLWDTLKLEEIYGTLYSVQCDIIYRRHHVRGTSRPLIEKLCSGMLLFVLLLLIIFGPLLLFSTANPVSQSNPVVATAVSLSLTSGQGEYPLVSITSFTVAPITPVQFVAMQNDDLVQGSDRMDSIQSIVMASYSDQVWDISPPALATLMTNLNNKAQTMSLKLDYSFTRSSGPQNDKIISNVAVVPISQTAQMQLASIINQTLASERSYADALQHATRNGSTQPSFAADGNGGRVVIENVAPQYLRLPATSDPIEFAGTNNRSDIVLTLDVAQGPAGSPIVRWWFVNETHKGVETPIQFITVSNRIFAGPLSNLSYSIVSVYVVVLFTVGQFVRLLFGNQVTRIPVDDLPNANKLSGTAQRAGRSGNGSYEILRSALSCGLGTFFCVCLSVQIVEGIYIARQKKQLAKEEILYRRLLVFFRNPALMLEFTRREDSEEEKKEAQRNPHDDGQQPPTNGQSDATADNDDDERKAGAEDERQTGAAADSAVRARRKPTASPTR